MDVITHLALGVCTAEVLLTKRWGKKALLWGAATQALPDIDTLPALFFPADQSLLIHRGLTHSFLFALIMGALLAFLLRQTYGRAGLSYTTLFFFFIFELALHDLIDTCNSYGTGLLEPFSHERFSINLLYVADPLFTAGLIIASLVLIVKSMGYQYRKTWAGAVLLFSAGYTAYAGFNKACIDRRARQSFRSQHTQPAGYLTTPAPFNCMLWYIIAAADSGYYTAYSSVWDDPRQPIVYERQLKNERLAHEVKDQLALAHLIRFADGYYTFSQTDGSIYFNVLRFEQVQGWRMPRALFVLAYPLNAGGHHAEVLQQGRLAGWDKKAFQTYLRRIAGHQP